MGGSAIEDISILYCSFSEVGGCEAGVKRKLSGLPLFYCGRLHEDFICLAKVSSSRWFHFDERNYRCSLMHLKISFFFLTTHKTPCMT